MSSLVDLRDVFVVHPSEDGGVAALRGLTLGVEQGEICVRGSSLASGYYNNAERTAKGFVQNPLNPHYPEYWTFQLGPIFFDAHQYPEAITTLESLRLLDTIGVHLYLAASHAALGHVELARAALARVMGFDAQATIQSLAPTYLSP